MGKKIMATFLVLVMALLLLVACAEELPSPQEIVDGVIGAQNNVLTCEVEMDMIAKIPAEDYSSTQSFSGALDSNSREMRMEINQDDMGEVYYLIDDIVYLGDVWEEEIEWWFTDTASEEDWEEVRRSFIRDSQIQLQIELLKTTQIDVIGSESVKDVDCYLLQLTPDVEQLWSLVLLHPSVSFIVYDYDTPTKEALQEMFPSFSVKQWVAKDTHYLTRAEVNITLELTPENIGWPDEIGEIKVDTTMSLLVYNHNQPVSIVLPPEAEELEVDILPGAQGAADTELSNVQNATISMMIDNGLSILPNPVTEPTNDMSAFPDTSVCGVDKVQDRDGNAYVRGKDKDGYILYNHDINGDATSTSLVSYVPEQYTRGTYIVDALGTVTQVTTGFE